jgi:hypothetical protein
MSIAYATASHISLAISRMHYVQSIALGKLSPQNTFAVLNVSFQHLEINCVFYVNICCITLAIMILSYFFVEHNVIDL